MVIRDFTLYFPTRGFCHVVDITAEVQSKIDECRVHSGHVTLFVVGSTAGITTVEYEPGLVNDLEELFNRLAPPTANYHHEQAWQDGNGFSHVRASLLKPSLTVPVVHGRMRLGTWQQIVLIDFDNHARNRELAVQVMGIAD
jgi:secondary thiamine-phosphate synthase enzyme